MCERVAMRAEAGYGIAARTSVLYCKFVSFTAGAGTSMQRRGWGKCLWK